MDVKKKRGSNFTSNEIGLLMKLLAAELKIIENKQTDGATLREKNQAWQRVSAAFNSMCGGDYRDANSLKMKFENIKKTLKKKISESKENYKGTGGGPPVDIKLLWYEEELYSHLQLGIEGLPPVGDSDVTHIEEVERNHDYCITYDIDHEDGGTQQFNEAPQLIEEDWNTESILIVDPSQETDSAVSLPLTNKNTIPQNSSQPLPNKNHILQNVSQNSTSSTPLSSNRWNLKKRKRTTITSTEKKNNAESFQILTQNKTDLINIQKDCYKVELSTKQEEEKNINKEWQLKRKILELDLQIKQEQYNELKEEYARRRTLLSLQEEEQKIKLEILKCELNMKIKQSLALPDCQ